MIAATPLPADLIGQTVRFSQRLMQASGVVFFWLDENCMVSEPQPLGITRDCLDRYDNEVWRCDPLLASRLANQHKRVGHLAEEQKGIAAPDAQRYSAFLRGYGVTDCLDMLFWNEDTAFAGLGFMKRASDPPLSPAAVEAACDLQAYFECVLKTHPHVLAQQARRSLAQRFNLTPREVEVVELVCNGATNPDIAQLLSIGLATAKTHLTNIFNKMGVENRAALVASAMRLSV